MGISVRRSMCVTLFVLMALTGISASQDQTGSPTIRIELTDGTILVGHILSQDNVSIQFQTLSNIVLSINKDLIRKREIVEGYIEGGILWMSDPNRTRLLFAPTGRALKKGQGYFSVYEIFFPFLAVGLTDWMIIAGGFTLIPGAESQLLYVAPKITPVRMEQFDLSGGVLFIKIPEEAELAGILYGVGTYGTEKAALTVGLGFAFAGGDIADKPVFVLGGELRTSQSTKLITENWLIPDSEVQLISAGIRFFGEKLAADFAFFYPAGADSEGWPFLPWVGFAYNFGKQR